ncbi:hypothetical protein ACIQVK_29085 [Streptomyces sp. NPDC090493]|uniref:hypothetical protein n=1 Tax=Streptomyces sp. NPDC090493 TaxID=3365964 RepID=UPI003804D8D6
MNTRLSGMRLAGGVAAASVVLGFLTTAPLAVSTASHSTPPTRGAVSAVRCTAPALPGRVVDVTVSDMGPGMMNGGPRWYGMRLTARPAAVPTGPVSLRVLNAGHLTHEVVVLPLPAAQAVGDRSIGTDGRVDESGSLGEASRSCGAGTGGGIAPGTAAWVTLTLRPGRYELVCNLPGHYAAGARTELDVASR